MPQMSPLYWLLLFMFFSLIFMFNMILNFFIKKPIKLNPEVYHKYDNKTMWKW